MELAEESSEGHVLRIDLPCEITEGRVKGKPTWLKANFTWFD